MNYLESFPAEACEMVLLHLEPEDIYAIWNCSRTIRRALLKLKFFWKKKCKMNGYRETISLFNNAAYKKFSKLLDFWPGLYLFICSMNYNWKNNIYEKIEYRLSDIARLNYYSEEIVIVTTFKNQIFLLNSSNGEIIKWIGPIGRSGATSINGNSLLLAEHSTTIRTWDLSVYDFTDTVRFFTSKEIIEIFSHEKLIGVRFCNFEFFIRYHGKMLRRVNDLVFVVHFHKNLIIYQHHGYEIDILDIDQDLNLSGTIVCCEGCIFRNMSANGKYLIFWCSNEHYSVWDVETCTKLFFFGAESPENIQIDIFEENKFILFKQFSNTAEVWNIETKSRMFIIDNQENICKILTYSRSILTFSNYCRTLKIWCSITGNYVTRVNLMLHLQSFERLSPLSVTETQLFIIRHGHGNKNRLFRLNYGVKSRHNFN